MSVHSKFTQLAATTVTFLTFFAANTHAAPISGQGTWQTTLQDRDINGDGTVDAFYDTSLNVTWLANANMNGLMNWNTAMNWASNLNVHGTTGWRLPSVNDTGASGCDFGYSGTDCGWNVQTSTGNATNSELAHLYYVTLGNLAGLDSSGNVQPGFGLTNTANFTNFEQYVYWSGTEYAPITGYAWYFGTIAASGAGSQDYGVKNVELYAVGVRSGDVGAAVVPVAPTVALMLPLLGLMALRKRPA